MVPQALDPPGAILLVQQKRDAAIRIPESSIPRRERWLRLVAEDADVGPTVFAVRVKQRRSSAIDHRELTIRSQSHAGRERFVALPQRTFLKPETIRRRLAVGAVAPAEF